jgi:hypothetical protein
MKDFSEFLNFLATHAMQAKGPLYLTREKERDANYLSERQTYDTKGL